MKKVIVLSLVTALLVGVVMAADQPTRGDRDEPSQPVKIGALLPLSGRKAQMGVQQRHALEMAQERLKTEHGVEIEVIFEDTRTDPKVGEEGARKLIEEKGVLLVLAFPCDVVYKTQPITDEAGALLMACNTDPITAGISPRTFRVFPNLLQQNNAIVKHLGEGDGKRTAIIRQKVPSSDNAMKQLFPALKDKGWKVVAEVAYDGEIRDYAAAVNQVKAANPDVILMYLDTQAVPPLLKLLRKEPSLAQAKIVGGISLTNPYKLPPEVLEGVAVAAPSCALSNQAKVASSWFGIEFRERYGSPPHMFAAFCFDSAMLVGHAIKEQGSDPTDVQAYLKTVKDYPGVTGRITFDGAGDANVVWDIGIYTNGKLVPIGEKK